MSRELEQFYCEVGAGRSGTNILGMILAAHPQLAYWRRPKYVWRHGNAWKDHDALTGADASPRIRRYIRRTFRDYAQDRGKSHLLVCTQACSLALGFVNEVYPEGKIIHIIRDGREVAASQSREWTTHVRKDSSRFLILRRALEVPPSDLPAYGWEFLASMWKRVTGAKYRYSWGPKPKGWKQKRKELTNLGYGAWSWARCVGEARRVGRTMPKDRYYEIRFEDLMARPHEATRALLDFMELPAAAEIDDFIDAELRPGNVGKWLRKLSGEQMHEVRSQAGPLLDELGYTGEAPPEAAEQAE